MTNASPIRIRRAGFRVGGKGRWLDLVLLYQDKLAAVSRRAEALGCFLGLLLGAGITYRSADGFGAVAGILFGRFLGQQADRRTAASRVTRGGRGVTVIPLDSITSVRAGSKDFLGTPILVVTTQDQAEYRMYGWLGTWQADLAAALTARGRQVQVTPEGITIARPTAAEALRPTLVRRGRRSAAQPWCTASTLWPSGSRRKTA